MRKGKITGGQISRIEGIKAKFDQQLVDENV